MFCGEGTKWGLWGLCFNSQLLCQRLWADHISSVLHFPTSKIEKKIIFHSLPFQSVRSLGHGFSLNYVIYTIPNTFKPGMVQGLYAPLRKKYILLKRKFVKNWCQVLQISISQSLCHRPCPGVLWHLELEPHPLACCCCCRQSQAASAATAQNAVRLATSHPSLPAYGWLHAPLSRPVCRSAFLFM